MSEFDRLSSLIHRFSLQVTPVPGAPVNLIILQDIQTGQPSQIILSPLSSLPKLKLEGECVMFSARTTWGGGDNPLFATLPEIIKINIQADSDLAMVVRLLKTESEAQRCGMGGVLNRLGEVLMISVLRQQIEMGTSMPGLLNGLADSRLSKAIVCMHETPGKLWNNESLAGMAGFTNQPLYAIIQSKSRPNRPILLASLAYDFGVPRHRTGRPNSSNCHSLWLWF